MSPFYALVLGALALILPGFQSTTFGVTTVSVVIADNLFSPANVTNSVGDSVKWTWQGANSHSSTGPGFPALWDSGIHGNGFVFTQKFSNVGTFPYHCVVHSFQKGTIVVQAVSTSPPPALSIVSPTNGTTFAAPWTGTVNATISDPGNAVSNLELFVGPVLLASLPRSSSNITWNVTQLPPGDYNLVAVAVQASGATNASTSIRVSVVTPVPVTLENFSRPGPSTVQFSYSTTPGLSYLVQRSPDLFSWTPQATNNATTSLSTFVDTAALDAFNFYSVVLLPNP